MQITVTVDETVVVEAARKAFAEAFRQPEYRDRQGGAGYETLRGQVAEFVRTMDLREHIRGAARAALDVVVREVLEVELRAHVKAAAKAMRQTGELFDQPNNMICVSAREQNGTTETTSTK